MDLLRKDEAAGELLQELDLDDLRIPAVAVMELWEGAICSKTTSLEKIKVDELLEAFTIYNLDGAAAKQAAEINNALRHAPLETEDVMIAAIALARGEKLVTSDAHFARVPGLRVLKY
ncbi:PIN domain-containing protein [Candidatus Magnetobacterium casense]|uniref:PIN domain-containing protein n=1 Tax=Candidatus Magnetobacterium casense TaxID=1455061 RepID=UPI002A4E2D83|nr:PIN domain-containing protein [Candidatus Magnetobacterium casensis]